MGEEEPPADHATTPNATTIEEAPLRIKVAAHIVDTIAQTLRGDGETHGDALVLMADDIEAAVETIYPVIQHLFNEQNRRAAA